MEQSALPVGMLSQVSATAVPVESGDGDSREAPEVAPVIDPMDPPSGDGRIGAPVKDVETIGTPKSADVQRRVERSSAEPVTLPPLISEEPATRTAAPGQGAHRHPARLSEVAADATQVRSGVPADAAAALSSAIAAARGASDPVDVDEQPDIAPGHVDTVRSVPDRAAVARTAGEPPAMVDAAPDVGDTVELDAAAGARASQADTAGALRIAHTGSAGSGANHGHDQRSGGFTAPQMLWPVPPAPSGNPVASDTLLRLAGGSSVPTPSDTGLSTVGPQLIRSLQMQVRDGGGQVRLTLSPEHLGTVTVDVRVEGRQVTAVLAAETAAVRSWLTAHEQDLRAGLAELGLTLENLVIRDEDTPRERQQQARDHARQPLPNQRSGDEPAFEIRV